MSDCQTGILASLPAHARYLSLRHVAGISPAAALKTLAGMVDGKSTVVGLGAALVEALGGKVPGLRPFPTHAAGGVNVPATPVDLWCWVQGVDRGDIHHRCRSLEKALAPAFRLVDSVDAFFHLDGRDLSGFEDGTENPKKAKAVAAAVVKGQGAGLDGSSLVAVQQWVHDLDALERMTARQQDLMVGRHKDGNVEIANAPKSAHVKRTAQESFVPEAFVLRRSMPWTQQRDAGLMFVAFGHSLDAFEAQLRRMVGAEDGIVDALFKMSRPITGAYFWCPPVKRGRLLLAAVGL